MALAEFVREESGLVWVQGRDGVWRAGGTGGTFAVAPGPQGDQIAWFLPRGGKPVSLGSYGTLGGAYGAARRYEPATGQMAAEDCGCGQLAAECPGGCGPDCGCAACRQKMSQNVTVLAAEETARVLYEDRPGKAKPLRWHRSKFGYEAKGLMGRYSIVRRAPDRRRGVLPIVLSLNDTEIKAFDLKQEAQAYAAKYEKGGLTPPSTPKPSSMVCGPLARIAVDADAAAKCKALADAIGPIDGVQDVYRLLEPELSSYAGEVFVVVPLNVQGLLAGPPVRVGEGQRSKVSVDTADILRAVILSGASSFWVAHCHPSGKAKPSSADRHLTEVVQRSSDAAFGKARGIAPSVKFAGHAVIGHKQVADARNGRIYRIK